MSEGDEHRRRVAKDREEGLEGLRDAQEKKPAVTLTRGYDAGDLTVKEMSTKGRVMKWLFPEWVAVIGPDPPDIYATDGEYVRAIEVVAQSLLRHGFDVSDQELRFKDGEAVFIMEIETKEGFYEYLVLTPSEMAAKLRGRHRAKNRNHTSVPRSLKGWEEHVGRKDKLKWRPGILDE